MAGRRDPGFDAREAADALLAGRCHGVERDLLVRARLDAVTVSLAALLIDHHEAVLALVDRVAGTGVEAGRLRAVVAQPWQVEEVGVRPLALALVLVPVVAPRGPAAVSAARLEPLLLSAPFEEHLVVVELECVATLDERRERAGSRAPLGVEASALLFEVARMAAARAGGHAHPAHVLGARPLRPQTLAGHHTGLATHALAEIDHRGELARGCRERGLAGAALHASAPAAGAALSIFTKSTRSPRSLAGVGEPLAKRWRSCP